MVLPCCPKALRERHFLWPSAPGNRRAIDRKKGFFDSFSSLKKNRLGIVSHKAKPKLFSNELD